MERYLQRLLSGDEVAVLKLSACSTLPPVGVGLGLGCTLCLAVVPGSTKSTTYQEGWGARLPGSCAGTKITTFGLRAMPCPTLACARTLFPHILLACYCWRSARDSAHILLACYCWRAAGDSICATAPSILGSGGPQRHLGNNAGTLPCLWHGIPVLQVVCTMQYVRSRLG